MYIVYVKWCAGQVKIYNAFGQANWQFYIVTYMHSISLDKAYIH